MEVVRHQVQSLLDNVRRITEEDINIVTLDAIQIRGERLLFSVSALLVDLNYSPTIGLILPRVQEVVQRISNIANDLEALDYGGYRPGSFSFSGRGRPRINVEKDMLVFFLDNGFSASTISSLLHTSLSTIRRRMALFGLSVRSRCVST
jgi:hypothetical protein